MFRPPPSGYINQDKKFSYLCNGFFLLFFHQVAIDDSIASQPGHHQYDNQNENQQNADMRNLEQNQRQKMRNKTFNTNPTPKIVHL